MTMAPEESEAMLKDAEKELDGAKTAEDTANRIKTHEKITPKVVKLPPKTAATNNVRRPSR
jgi:hypothetical protein